MKTVLPGTVQAQTRIVRTGNFDLTLITGSLGYPHFKLHQEADTKNVVFLPPNKKPYWFDFGWLANHDVMVHIFGLYDEQELLDAELLKLKRLVCVSQYDNCLADVETILPNGQVVAAEQGMPAHLETYFLGD